MYPRPLKTVLQIFKCQIIAAMLALILTAILKHSVLLSFCLGEAAMLAGNGVLTWLVYRQNKKLVPMSLFNNFMAGELAKYIVLIVLTFLFAKYILLNWLFYIIGIAIPQLFGVVIYFILKSYRSTY